MTQITYEVVSVSDLYVECSLSMPPSYRTRCRLPATHAVLTDKGHLMFRCLGHRDIQKINPNDNVIRGDYTEVIPRKREI